MAEITDNIGEGVNLEVMSPRHHQHKMASGENLGGAKQNADAKLGAKLAQLVEKVNQTKTQNKLQAIELETNSVNADMNDFYRDAEATIKEQLSGMSLQQLGNFDDNWNEGGLVLPDGETTIKPFKISDDVSEESKQFLEPYLKDKDSAFTNQTREFFSAELKKRAIQDIEIKKSRTINGLESQMLEYSLELEKSGIGGNIPRKNMINTFTNGGYEPANELSRNFKTNVLDPKVKSLQMDQQKADVELEEYNKRLAHSIFNHFARFDDELAVEIAKKGGFSVNGTQLDSDVYGRLLLNKLNDNRTKTQQSIKNKANQTYFNEARLNPEKFLKKWGEFKDKKFTGEIRKLNQSDKALLKEQGYFNEDEFTTSIKGYLYTAITGKEKNDKEKERDKDILNDKKLQTWSDTLSASITHQKNIHQKYLAIAHYEYDTYTVDGKEAMYVPTTDMVMNLGKDTGHIPLDLKYEDKDKENKGWNDKIRANFEKVKHTLASAVKGVRVFKPKETYLPDGDFEKIANDVDSYWRHRILASENTRIVKNPVEDETSLWSLLHKDQHAILSQRIKGYKAIAQFNENDFNDKSAKYLLEKMSDIEKTFMPSGENKEWAFSRFGIYDGWKSSVLLPRITNLIKWPNETLLKDLGLWEQVSNDNGKITKEIKDKMFKRINQTGGGEAREFVAVFRGELMESMSLIPYKFQQKHLDAVAEDPEINIIDEKLKTL